MGTSGSRLSGAPQASSVGADTAARPRCQGSAGVGRRTSLARLCVMALATLATLGSLSALALLSQSKSGDQSLTEALARGASPPLSAAEAMGWLGLAGVALGTALLWRVRLTRDRRARAARARWGWVLLLAAWVTLGAMQDVISMRSGAFGPLEADAGYVALPAALGATWWLATTAMGGAWRRAWSRPAWGWVFGALMALFALFYFWTSKQVQVPSPHDMPPHGTPSFVVTSSFYGPLAVWPSVEFWVAPLKLDGGISLGSALVTVTQAALTALVLTLYITSAWQVPGRRLPGRAGLVATLSTAAFSSCCCCSPAIFPLLATLLGSAGAGSVGAWLSGTSSPLSDVVQAATIGFLLGMLAWQRRRLTACAT
jgi:hypothetical protein